MHHDEDHHFTFNPPLYIQRYQYVSQLVSQFQVKSILDIGCAECKLINYLKNNIQMNFIVGLDIDHELLNKWKHILEPNGIEYVDKRSEPLEISILSGDISLEDERFLSKLGNGQLDMISLVEVIEHMSDVCLKKCVQQVFGRLQPHYVVITTPNSDFNIVFGHMQSKYRHWDHKFEWSRVEFNKWCHSITQLHPQYYIYTIDGLGKAPDEFDDVGFCSQLVIFINRTYNESNNLNNYIQDLKDLGTFYPLDSYIGKFDEKSTYKLIDSIKYPFKHISLTNIPLRNATLMDEINWLVKWLSPTSERGKKVPSYESVEYEENCLTTDDYNLLLIERLYNFHRILKLKIPPEEMVEIIRSMYGVTKSGLYLIYQYPESSCHSCSNRSSLNSDLDESNVKLNDLEEEDWEIELEPRFRCYTPELQYEDAPNDPSAHIELPKSAESKRKLRKMIYNSLKQAKQRERYLSNINGQFDDANE